MSTPVFPPRKDADLVAWSANFSTKITAAPTTYGLTAAQATAYAALNTAFASAYTTAVNPATNSKFAVEAKNTAKQNLLHGDGGAWQLVDIVEAYPGTTNPMRTDLNIRIRDVDPTPVPAPTVRPQVDIDGTIGTTVSITVHEYRSANHRTKPEGVKGASVFWAIGENAPVSETGWTFAFNTTKNACDITLPTATPAGSKVWVTAFWFNAKMESGPAAVPVSVFLPGLAMAA